MNSYFWFEALSAQLKLKAPISGRVRVPAMSGTGYPTRVSGNPVSLRGGYWDYKFSRTRVRVPVMSGAGTRGLPVSPPLSSSTNFWHGLWLVDFHDLMDRIVEYLVQPMV